MASEWFPEATSIQDTQDSLRSDRCWSTDLWFLNYNPKTLFYITPVLLCKRCPASTQQQLQHNTTSFWWEDGEYFCYCMSTDICQMLFIRTEPFHGWRQGARAKKERGEQWKCVWRRPCVVRIKLQCVWEGKSPNSPHPRSPALVYGP